MNKQTNFVFCSGVIGLVISYYKKFLILLFVILLNGGHCIRPWRLLVWRRPSRQASQSWSGLKRFNSFLGEKESQMFSDVLNLLVQKLFGIKTTPKKWTHTQKTDLGLSEWAHKKCFSLFLMFRRRKYLTKTRFIPTYGLGQFKPKKAEEKTFSNK